jgi:hypothetical protein
MSIDTDYRVLRDVLLRNNPQGWAIEFGVWSGYSLAIIAEYMPVIGLDSFEGLPEDWREGFPKGKFDTHGSSLPLVANAMIVPGWFSKTIPSLRYRGMPHFGLVHIDCDLFTSTREALEGVRNNIGPGTYVVFDEYHGYPGSEQHEERAWKEFCARNMVLANTVAEGEQERAFVIQSIGTGSR